MPHLHRLLFAAVVLLTLARARAAWAHEQSSGAAWVQPQGEALRLRVELDRPLASELGLERPPDETSRHRLLERLLQVRVDGHPCALARSDFAETPTGAWHLAALTTPCAGATLQLQSPLFQGETPEDRRGHVLLASVQQGFSTRRCVFGRVNTPCEIPLAATPSAPPERPPASAARSLFVAFLAHGVEHIARGLDHLLFVALVLVGSPRARDALWRLSAFSLGHAITLSLVAMSIITPPSRPVEVAIALSLVALGWSTARTTPTPGRTTRLATPGLTALFGLLHGLGFGAGLRDLGFEPGAAIPSLLGFHLGVELGQLTAAGLLWALVSWRRSRGGGLPLRRLAGALGVALGAVWALQRLA